jgi:hypothetical protein
MSIGSLPLPLDRAVAPLDRLRRRVLLGLVRAPALGALLARRDRRLMVHSVAGVLVAFALAVLAPGMLFVVGPAVFGVAHVAADARYLVLRRSLPRWWAAVLVGGCVALFALRALESAAPGAAGFATAEVAIGWAWALAGVAAGAVAAGGEAARRRALLVGPVVAAVGIIAVSNPHLARLVFAHVHNVVAIALWVFLFRARRRFALPAVALLAVGSALLLSGVALPWVHFDGPGAERLVDESVFAWPAWMPQRTAVALGVVFVMLQSIHYSVWLAFIPQDDLRGEGTLSFRMSLRALRRDFPAPLLAVVVVLAAAVLGASFLDVHRTRGLYMSLASFHGYLELAAATFLIVRGRS